MKLFEQHDGMFNATSNAPSNAKYAVILNQHLTDMLFTEKEPEVRNGVLYGETCDGRSIIIGSSLPYIVLGLPADFPRKEEITVTVDEEEPLTEEATVKVLEDPAPGEDVVVKVVEEGSPAEEIEAATS